MQHIRGHWDLPGQCIFIGLLIVSNIYLYKLAGHELQEVYTMHSIHITLTKPSTELYPQTKMSLAKNKARNT